MKGPTKKEEKREACSFCRWGIADQQCSIVAEAGWLVYES